MWIDVSPVNGCNFLVSCIWKVSNERRTTKKKKNQSASLVLWLMAQHFRYSECFYTSKHKASSYREPRNNNNNKSDRVTRVFIFLFWKCAHIKWQFTQCVCLLYIYCIGSKEKRRKPETYVGRLVLFTSILMSQPSSLLLFFPMSHRKA